MVHAVAGDGPRLGEVAAEAVADGVDHASAIAPVEEASLALTTSSTNRGLPGSAPYAAMPQPSSAPVPVIWTAPAWGLSSPYRASGAKVGGWP